MSGRISRIKVLPDQRGPQNGEKLPADLAGARIIQIGMAGDGQKFAGGGLVIDYEVDGCPGIRRVVLGFNDLGMWVQAFGPR